MNWNKVLECKLLDGIQLNKSLGTPRNPYPPTTVFVISVYNTKSKGQNYRYSPLGNL